MDEMNRLLVDNYNWLASCLEPTWEARNPKQPRGDFSVYHFAIHSSRVEVRVSSLRGAPAEASLTIETPHGNISEG